MNQVITNVEALLSKYGNKLNDNNKLVLIYWREFCNVRMDQNNISMEDFLKNVKMYDDIINARRMIDLYE